MKTLWVNSYGYLELSTLGDENIFILCREFLYQFKLIDRREDIIYRGEISEFIRTSSGCQMQYDLDCIFKNSNQYFMQVDTYYKIEVYVDSTSKMRFFLCLDRIPTQVIIEGIIYASANKNYSYKFEYLNSSKIISAGKTFEFFNLLEELEEDILQLSNIF